MHTRAQLEANIASIGRLVDALTMLIQHRPLAHVRPALLDEYERLIGIISFDIDAIDTLDRAARESGQ